MQLDLHNWNSRWGPLCQTPGAQLQLTRETKLEIKNALTSNLLDCPAPPRLAPLHEHDLYWAMSPQPARFKTAGEASETRGRILVPRAPVQN